MDLKKPRARTWMLALLAVVIVVAVFRWQAIFDAGRVLIAEQKIQPRKLFADRTRLPAEYHPFLDILSSDEKVSRQAEAAIEAGWKDSHAVLLLEMARLGGSLEHQPRLHKLLVRMTGQPDTWTSSDWWQWIWKENSAVPPKYADFKAVIYSAIDPRFEEYFDDDPPATIQLNEIRWGGVRRDGIPPLENPQKTAASDADFLDDDNVVFGVSINGEAVAYPKRILAWHEMVKDEVGGESINGAYCTLCGSMIVYNTKADGVHYDLGTSGFLYRSNKLMYDRATQSMWSTLRGEPVVGPLVGKGIRLPLLHVVTTTWGEWRRRHPETMVLSLETGHSRDYREGEAYRSYFSHDKVMFAIPQIDQRLKNKDEVLAIRSQGRKADALAIAADYLKKHRIYHVRVGGTDMVVLTDKTGANRVYETGGRKFTDWNDTDQAKDDAGTSWLATEASLEENDGDQRLIRLPAHRAFWFGWYAAYPQTRLVQ